MAQALTGNNQGHGLPSHTASQARNSLSDSQGSSFSTSTSRQRSLIRPISTGLVERGSQPQDVSSPSTSLSNNSNQEQAIDSHRHDRRSGYDKQDVAPALEMQPSEHFGNVGPSHCYDYSGGALSRPTSAPKRMANGDIKSFTGSLPTSPVDYDQNSHSGNNSLTSRGSQISEMSSRLKTRLSYAMAKVQNGWQGHNIRELEYMASQPNSPSSAVTNKGRAHIASLHAESPNGHLGSVQSAGRTPDTAMPDYVHDPPHRSLASPRQGYGLHAHFEESMQNQNPNQAGRTYESFWREHSGNLGLKTSQAFGPAPGGPSLAPPVDIQPRNPRRPEAAMRQPLSLHTQNLENSHSYPTSTTSNAPATPPSKPLSKIRTPSQQTAVEIDAVETLLFMSSPGNSGYHLPAPLAGSPLRSHFVPAPTRPAQSVFMTQDPSRRMSLAYAQPSPGPTRILSGPDIDKLIDDMSDSSSSEEEELVCQR